ncbi:nicotinate-nucleotide adenylyltransferase [Candidatus Latescibacterota bacterium]
MIKKPNNLTDAKKIGIFGGTFDPVHNGHIIIAEKVREHAGLDIIIFIPSANPPHKHHILMFSPQKRYEMLKDAISGNPRFIISDIEIKRGGTSYTIDTLYGIKKELPRDAELFFIVGKDNLYEIELWKNPQEIIDECTILVAEYAEIKKKSPNGLNQKRKL